MFAPGILGSCRNIIEGRAFAADDPTDPVSKLPGRLKALEVLPGIQWT